MNKEQFVAVFSTICCGQNKRSFARVELVVICALLLHKLVQYNNCILNGITWSVCMWHKNNC